MKIAINSQHGGFTISPLAYRELAKRKGIELYVFRADWLMKSEPKIIRYVPLTFEEANRDYLRKFLSIEYFSIPNPPDYILYDEDSEVEHERFKIYFKEEERNSPHLIEVIELLGEDANTLVCKPKIIEIPDDVDWCIQEYDGLEWVAEKHRTWQ